jgi:hypothetical protein
MGTRFYIVSFFNLKTHSHFFLRFVSEENAVVDIVVHSWHLLWKPGFRGKVSIPIKDLVPGEETSKWYKLIADEGKKQQDYGEIRLSLNYKLGV